MKRTLPLLTALLLAPLAALQSLQAASAIHAENYEEAFK